MWSTPYLTASSVLLQSGDKVEIRGFGSFHTRQRRGRIGRNPRTGARIEVPPKRIPFFKLSKELRKLVDSLNLKRLRGASVIEFRSSHEPWVNTAQTGERDRRCSGGAAERIVPGGCVGQGWSKPNYCDLAILSERDLRDRENYCDYAIV